MSEHRDDIRLSESCLDPNPFMAERQDPDNFPRLQTRERCALEIAAYVFKLLTAHHFEFQNFKGGCTGLSESTLVKMPHCWKSHVTAHLFWMLKRTLLGYFF